MIILENTEVVGFEAAIRGMRNPMNSWSESDSTITKHVLEDWPHNTVKTFDGVGPKDFKLMANLRDAGTDHRKFMRMIIVYVDITAPLYWWKEFDTYTVGVVKNSCSTMHKIHAKEFTLDDFSCEHLLGEPRFLTDSKTPGIFGATQEFDTSSVGILRITCDALNYWRERYLAAIKTKPETGLSAKDIWWQMIQLLPLSYNQRRTVMMSYEVLANQHKARHNHKLDEWIYYCEWVRGLPCSWLIDGNYKEGEKE